MTLKMTHIPAIIKEEEEEEEEEVLIPPSMCNIADEFTTCTTMPMIIDNDTSNTVILTIIKDKFNHDRFTATINTIEKKSGCDRLFALLDGVCTTNNRPIPPAKDIISKISQLFQRLQQKIHR